MDNLRYYQQVFEDVFKRSYIEFVKRGGRLQTPMGMFVSILHAQGYLPKEITALAGC